MNGRAWYHQEAWGAPDPAVTIPPLGRQAPTRLIGPEPTRNRRSVTSPCGSLCCIYPHESATPNGSWLEGMTSTPPLSRSATRPPSWTCSASPPSTGRDTRARIPA